MNTLIPVELYYPLFINLCLFLVLFTMLHSLVLKMNDRKNIIFINFSGYLLLFFLIIYIGQRPIHRFFGDTVNYNFSYLNYQAGNEIGDVNDLGWHIFMKTMSNFISIHGFLTICAFIYIFPLYKISKSLFGNYWYYAFVMFVISFSFWAYAVNGVRNGAATSLFLWGLAYRKKPIIMSSFFLIAVLFHKTLLLPIAAFLMTYIYNKPKSYLIGWLASIPISLFTGGFWIALFAGLGFGDDRLEGYLTSEIEHSGAGGFRWDFIFHSAFAVFAGWYFIFKKDFKDPFYNQLLNTYLICNSFWILVIKANFSNRFAYLSWFMMALVIIYPVLKERMFLRQNRLAGLIMIAYFSFTYLMYYIYYA